MKNLLIIAMILSCSVISAQRNYHDHQKRLNKSSEKSLLMASDTLFYFEGFYYMVNPEDYDNFDMEFIDLDGNTPVSQYWTTDWSEFYTTDTSWFITEADFQRDTANFTGVTSWFDPPGQADDWFTFGPLTIPGEGATLGWMHKFNPVYRNGYSLKLSTSGSNNYDDFTGPPVFEVTDTIDQTSSSIDTVWTRQWINIPEEYQGEQLYFAFHHYSFDKDVLWLDEVVALSGQNAGIGSSDHFIECKTYPVPARDHIVFELIMERSSPVTISIFDSQLKRQKKINSRSGNQGRTRHNIDLNKLKPGLYFYRINTKNGSSSGKFIKTQ